MSVLLGCPSINVVRHFGSRCLVQNRVWPVVSLRTFFGKPGLQLCHGDGAVTVIPRRCLQKRTATYGHRLVPQYKKDKVPPGFEFAYCKSNLSYFTIGLPSAIILFGTCLGISVYVLVQHHIYKQSWNRVEWSTNYNTQDPVPLVYLGIIILTVIAAVFVKNARNIILRMYHNESTNEFYGVILRYGVWKNYVQFKPSDIEEIVPMTLEGNVNVCGYKVLVPESNFVNFVYYNKFMGYAWNKESQYEKALEAENIQVALKKMAELQQKKRGKLFEEKYLEKRQKLKRGNSRDS